MYNTWQKIDDWNAPDLIAAKIQVTLDNGEFVDTLIRF
jgi:hypothetical protein